MGEDGSGGFGAPWRPSGPPRTGVEAPRSTQASRANGGRECVRGDAPTVVNSRLLRYASDAVDCIIDELPAPWEIDHAARRADAQVLARATDAEVEAMCHRRPCLQDRNEESRLGDSPKTLAIHQQALAEP